MTIEAITPTPIFNSEWIGHLAQNTHALALRVKEIAEEILQKIPLVPTTLAISVTVMFFFQTPISIPLLTLALFVSWAGRHAIEQVARHCFQRELTLPKIDEKLALFTLATLVSLSFPYFLIHETGHSIAALACFQQAGPCMNIFPFQGGQTDYAVSYPLTQFGKWLGGKERSILFIAGAGMIATTLFALTELGVAELIKEKYPQLSQFMNWQAVTHIFNEVIYGLTAFNNSRFNLCHDYIHLWQVGNIHPLIPLSLMLLLPLLEMGLFKAYQMLRESERVQEFFQRLFSLRQQQLLPDYDSLEAMS